MLVTANLPSMGSLCWASVLHDEFCTAHFLRFARAHGADLCEMVAVPDMNATISFMIETVFISSGGPWRPVKESSTARGTSESDAGSVHEQRGDSQRDQDAGAKSLYPERRIVYRSIVTGLKKQSEHTSKTLEVVEIEASTIAGVDDATGGELSWDAVRRARKQELRCFTELGV